MIPTSRIATACFWIALCCILSGGLLGMAGIWIPGVWESDLAFRCLLSDVVLFLTASSVSALATTWFKQDRPKK